MCPASLPAANHFTQKLLLLRDFGSRRRFRRWILNFLAVGPKFFRDGFQRGVKLHEGMIHGRVIVVALPALSFRQRLLGLGIASKSEIGPCLRESIFVLSLHRQTSEAGLKMSRPVDGAFRFG